MSKKKVKTDEELLQDALVPIEEQPYEIPSHWKWVRLNELITESKLGIVRSAKEQSDVYQYYYLKMNNIQSNGTLDFSSVVSVNASTDEVSAFKLQKGDLLFNTRNSYELVGKSAVYEEIGETHLFNNNILRLRFRTGCDSRFINFYLNSPIGKLLLNKIKSGTTNVAAIYAKDLYTLALPLPPKEEQKLIAVKIERMLDNILHSKQLLEVAKQTFELRRASLLEKAFSGALTKKWREENYINQEPMNCYNHDKIENLPVTWEFKKLEKVVTYLQRGKSPKYNDDIKLYPVISQKCVQRSGFEIDKARFIEPDSIEKYTKERFLQEGDLLWNSTGNGTIGRIAIYSNETHNFKFVVADSHVTVIRVDRSSINPKFMYYFLSSPYIQDHKINDLISGTTNQTELQLSKVKELEIIIPPLDEQDEIVRILESINKSDVEIQDRIDDTEKIMMLLSNSILSKAFKGEL